MLRDTASVSAEDFAGLARGATSGWRLEHWRVKIELETLDRAIGRPKPQEWTPARLALAERWFATQERLYREVYRLGPVRHVLDPRFMPPAWFESWNQATRSGVTAGSISPRQ
jgi:hypothetical protein